MIEFKDFTFQYAESTAPTLHDINLTLAPGTFLGITGAAGSGKSTLTYAFNGIIPHCYPGDFYGSVHVCGLDTVEADLPASRVWSAAFARTSIARWSLPCRR